MEHDKEEAIENFLDVRCDALSLNLIKLLSENNTHLISSPFKLPFNKPDIRTILS